MPQNYTQRSSGAQLPSADELLDILKKESPRKAVRYDFIQKNSSLFAAHRTLSRLAGADDSWIDTYPTLDLATLVTDITKTHSKIAAYITAHPSNSAIYQALYTSLIPQDDFSPSEALFVFGATSNARIERAVQLYQQAIAPKIIISGKGPHYTENLQSEAERMAIYAANNGIPTANLILEDASVTLPDNVKRSIDLLESIGWHPKSITLVATNFVLTRALFEWYKFCPWDITIRTVMAHPQSSAFTVQGWTNHKNTVALVLNEYAKLVLESKIDCCRRNGEIAY